MEDHPGQGIICQLYLKYEPELVVNPTLSIITGTLWLTQVAMDRSVVECVAERGPLPSGISTTGDFRRGPDDWKHYRELPGLDQTVGEVLREETAHFKRQRDAEAGVDSTERPSAERLVSWTSRWHNYHISSNPPVESFEEHRDLLDVALDRGADPNGASTLFYAVQMLDTSLAEWLLSHGADPNWGIRRGIASYLPDTARTRRMLNLLERYGAESNPYTRSLYPGEEQSKQVMERLKEQFL